MERLASGTYELAFDGRVVGAFTAEDLYRGVNVALLDTPNKRLACAAADLAEKLKQKTDSWRTLINMEKLILTKAGIDPLDVTAADAYFEKWVGQMETEKKPWAKYYRNSVNSYRKLRDRKPQLAAEIDDLYERLNAIRPAVSRVTVSRK